MDAPPILPSSFDLERQRLESTLDHDLSSLSLSMTGTSTSFASSSLSTIPVGRAAVAPMPQLDEYPRFPTDRERTPRAFKKPSYNNRTETSMGVSPTSTAGHHISAVTLGAGVFRRPGADVTERTDEYDPDRSIGRLTRELARTMQKEVSRITDQTDTQAFAPKPASPFRSPHSPRSPSPAPSVLPNLSLSLGRQDPLPSPPNSRTVSSSSSNSQGYGYQAQKNYVAGKRPVLVETSKQSRVPERVTSQPRNPRQQNESADVTGITALLATPAKGIGMSELDKNGGPVDSAGASIPQSLASLQARLRALETENSVSRRRVRELEGEIERANQEIAEARKSREAESQLREVIQEKTDLVESLRGHLARLTRELEENKALVSELRLAAEAASRAPPTPVRRHDESKEEIAKLWDEVDRLTREVNRLNDIAERGLAERTRSREERSVRIDALDLAEDDSPRRETTKRVEFSLKPSKLRQGLHAAAATEAHLMPPSSKPSRVAQAPDVDSTDGYESPTPSTPVSRNTRSASIASNHSHRSNRSHRSHREPEGPASPFPSIRMEDEQEFFSPSRVDRAVSPLVVERTHRASSPITSPLAERSGRRHRATSPLASSPPLSSDDCAEEPPRPSRAPKTRNKVSSKKVLRAVPASVRALFKAGSVPPQTVLTRVISELEADFHHFRMIYIELADQYKVLDVACSTEKRHVLAEHLKEVIDSMERKAEQVSVLYSLMTVEDREDDVLPQPPARSANDLWRAVRNSLSEEARRRLEADGLFRA